MTKYYGRSFQDYSVTEHNLTAVSEDFDPTAEGYPYASASIKRTPLSYSPNYSNEPHEYDPHGLSGLSKHAIWSIRNTKKSGEEYPENTGDLIRSLARGSYTEAKGAADEMAKIPSLYSETLFDTHPEQLKIKELFADTKMDIPAMNLVGIAKSKYPNASIVPSNDLSVHSSNLVKNAVNRGLISPNPDNPDAYVTNNVDYNERSRRTLGAVPREYSELGLMLSPDAVDKGKQEVRKMLRANKPTRNNTPVTPKGLSAQFLPGMEGFV
jgi:hypothetical protein